MGKYWEPGIGRIGADSGYLHIGLDEAAKAIRLILIEHNKNNEVVASEFRGHTSNIKGRRYLNLKPVKPENTASGFILVRYVIDKAALGISLMNARVVTRDIESGALAGRVIREEWTSNIHISASQEQLRDYLLTNDATLYAETKFLSRLNLPPGRVSP